MKNKLIQPDTGAFFLCIVVPAVIIMLVSHILLYRESSVDRALISMIEPPEWREVGEWEKEKAIENERPHYLSYIIALIFETIWAVCFGTIFSWNILGVLGIAIFFTLVFFIFSIIRHNQWKTMDYTAKCTIIPVTRIFTTKTRNKNTISYRHYYEIHTPDGKIALPKICGTSKEIRSRFSMKEVVTPHDVRELCIIEYKGMYTYVEYEEFSILNNL